MQLLRFDRETAQPIARFGSRFALGPILRAPGGVSIVCAYLEAGGLIARHPAAAPQLLLVVEGAGFVSGDDGVAFAIAAGQAASWEPGEQHETTTTSGLTAIIIEGVGVSPALLTAVAPGD